MPQSILWMPKISRHSYDIAVVAVRWDHTSGVSVLKVYRPCHRVCNGEQNGFKCLNHLLLILNLKQFCQYFNDTLTPLQLLKFQKKPIGTWIQLFIYNHCASGSFTKTHWLEPHCVIMREQLTSLWVINWYHRKVSQHCQ